MRRHVLLVVLVLGAAALSAGPAAAQQEWPPPECHAAEEAPAVGLVSCVVLESASVGGPVPVAYHVPARCLDGRTCATLLLLHGFSGDYRSMLGTAEEPSAFVEALDRRPPVPPDETNEPWEHADPADWVPAVPLDLVLVAPHGRTVPGGHGPEPDRDGFWTDWNPTYAAGGASPRYDTPAPRFTGFLLDEVLPWVHAQLPVGEGRVWNALDGVSLGGYGSYANALKHPGIWASVGSISGAHNFLFAPAPQPGDHAGVPLPGSDVAGPTPGMFSAPGQAGSFATALLAFGDPAADQVYYRGNMPVDLALNARGWAGEQQSLQLRSFVNDAVPRRAEDATDPASFLVAQSFEALVLEMNLTTEAAFTQQDVDRDFEIHPGLHAGAYWNPWLRQQLEAHAARVGQGATRPAARFDFRSIAPAFKVWGWGFTVDRPRREFLEVRDVTCDGLTLIGRGTVTVSVPPPCGTGLDGQTRFRVDLGKGPSESRRTVGLEPRGTHGGRGGAGAGGEPAPRARDPALPATGGGLPLVGATLTLMSANLWNHRRRQDHGCPMWRSSARH